MSTRSHDINTPLFFNIKRPYFLGIAAGTKTVEVRCAGPNFKNIAPGQYIRFDNGFDTVLVQVKRATRYESFEEMLAAEEPAAIVPGSDRDGVLAILKEIYPSEKENLGVIAFEIEKTA